MMKPNLLRFGFISQSIKIDVIYVLVIITIWTVMEVLVNPSGDFPLNDDWAYSQSVQSVIEKGDFRLSDWTATNLFSQVWWGVLFCLSFGFSFTTLRISTVILGLIGVISTYGLIREVSSNRQISIIGALLVAVNPLYFALSNTFMSDVPFFTFAILAFYFLVRGLKYDSNATFVLGILMACVALLQRQLGMAIFLAFGCAYIAKKGLNIKNFIKAFLPTLLGFCIQFTYQSWLRSTGRLPLLYGTQVNLFFATFSKGIHSVISLYFNNTINSLIYLGLFILPLFVILFPGKLKQLSARQKNLTLAISALFCVCLTGRLFSKHQLMPMIGNVLGDFWIGPLTIGGSLLSLPSWSYIYLKIATILSVVGSALIIFYLFFTLYEIFYKRSKSRFIEEKWLNTFTIATMFIYFFPIGGIAGIFDRYLIFLLPLSIIIAVVSTINDRWNMSYSLVSIALIMMLIYGGFTVGATHDYLSWNRARWQALHNLMQEDRISIHSIDGGFEFNGLYLYDKHQPLTLNTGKSWWVDRNDYIISFDPIPGYKAFKEYSFSRWIPFGEGKILVLHKITGSSH